jgi:4-hydroxy-tetrahydrodipicolinate reductase
MAKLIVAGAAGRMGRMLTSLVVQNSSHRLVGAVEAKGVKGVGADAGEIAGVGPIGVPIGDDYAAIASADTVTLDFTSATASMEHLAIAAAKGAAIVIGSTGFTPEMELRARELALRTRTLIAPNMSIGINVLLTLVERAAALLNGFDAEVLEIHHRTKVDAPSGTALALGKAVAAARGLDFQTAAVFGREGITGARPADQIGVMALRGGDAVGDHTVIFCGQGERLELIHRTQSREALASGAIRAAAWLEHQPNGLYNIRNVLGL